jgi:hypothetical protein
MIALVLFILAVLASPFKSQSRLEAENAALRHQLTVVRRKLHGRVLLTNNDRLFFILLYRWFPSVLKAITASPWQNGFAERLIGLIRRECVDHIIVLSEADLRRILTKYPAYYNALRTHRSLNKDAPFHRPFQRLGGITSQPVLGGLHHQILQKPVFGTHRSRVTHRDRKRRRSPAPPPPSDDQG